MAITSLLRGRLVSALAHRTAASEARKLLNVVAGQVAGASFTIGAEATDAIVVSIQLEDEHGNALAQVAAVEVLIFDDATGTTMNTDNYTIAAGTDGTVTELVADKVLLCTSESDGDIDVSLTIAGAATSYLGVVLPGGKLAISAAVTHAA